MNNNITIPEYELEFSASRAGGPGGQHVNKTSTKITVRWNVYKTSALDEAQKARVLEKLASELTNDGELMIHSSATRSQGQNKELAIKLLTEKVRAALHVPKKRMKKKVPKSIKEARLQSKKKRSALKKLRSSDYD